MRIFFSLCIGTSCCFGSDLWEEMSLEEKVGQVLMVHFHGEEINEDAKTLVEQVKVGGVIYYNWSNGLHSPEQVAALSSGLQTLAKGCRLPIPLLIATDQEGGVVARLQAGFTLFPGNRALGETLLPDLAKKTAFAMGEELHAVGINMNLAPVVDVNSNPKNPVIGVRSFGNDPNLVAAFGKEALEGFQQAHVIATLKHFPGYGDVAVDPHEDLPVIRKSKEALEAVELFPFAKLCPFADAVMTAHILVPALDPENCSTLSEKTLQYLRETIGFQGVIVADSLVMDGVLKKCHSVEEACIRALNAGCDLLILGGKLLIGKHTGLELSTADVQRIHSALTHAVQAGRIPEAKLNAAVARILKLKERYCIETSAEIKTALDTLEHQALAQKIASLAVRKVEKTPNSIAHLSKKRICIVAPDILEDPLEHTSLLKMGLSTEAFFFHGLNPSDAERKAAMHAAEKADVIVVCSYNAWKNPAAADLTESLLAMCRPVALLAVRDPLDAVLFPRADLIFTSFSPTLPSLQAICDELVQRQ